MSEIEIDRVAIEKVVKSYTCVPLHPVKADGGKEDMPKAGNQESHV